MFDLSIEITWMCERKTGNRYISETFFRILGYRLRAISAFPLLQNQRISVLFTDQSHVSKVTFYLRARRFRD